VGTHIAAEILLWLSVAALAYTYAGYPLLVAIVSRLWPRPVRQGEAKPSVSVIIAAYNEERDLARKLENTLALEYPRDRLEVIVVSDGSTDGTDEIAQSFAAHGVRLHRLTGRRGKTTAQNAAVSRSHGEILVFSDATTYCEPHVLRAMVRNFTDAAVGCVTGRVRYVDPTASAVGRGARCYWSYETFLRRHESRIGSLLGASGALYAVRRSCYVPLDQEACSDFVIATKMVEQGRRTIYEPEALCVEETNRRSEVELRMRVRIITQTLSDLWRHRAMLNPCRGGFYAVQLLSHKLLRYLVPFLLLTMLLVSAPLARVSGFYAVLLGAQLGFYAVAAASWAVERLGLRIGLLALPQYFVLANLAVVLALYQFLRGERYARWEPIRERAPAAATPTT
jgi:cellulose synthase/poly-beta-1,6-N-acetylglucosamine synthase-like glycosyltransferase